MSATAVPEFTAEEVGALLRAARARVDLLTQEVTRLHILNGDPDSYNRKLAALDTEELTHLQGAVRKLWVIKANTTT